MMEQSCKLKIEQLLAERQFSKLFQYISSMQLTHNLQTSNLRAQKEKISELKRHFKEMMKLEVDYLNQLEEDHAHLTEAIAYAQNLLGIAQQKKKKVIDCDKCHRKYDTLVHSVCPHCGGL